MTTSTTIKATVDSSILTKMKSAFTNSANLLAEAMQNARRAGATEVHFHYDYHMKKLNISDNGQGIDDFNALLTMALSGWEKSVTEAEGAFGIGFFSMLYQCEKISVMSNGNSFSATTEEILNGAPITVHAADEILQTCSTLITLEGFSMSAQDIHANLKHYAYGFPIDVIYNGERFERPHALDSDLTFIQSSDGHYSITHIDSIEHTFQKNTVASYGFGTENYLLYFQGLPLHSATKAKYGNIVHLDSQSYQVRLPDRDCLIDHALQVEKVMSVIKRFWVDKLTGLKQTLKPEQFVALYPTLKQWACLHLLDDIDYLPEGLIVKFSDTPELTAPYGCINVTKQGIISKQFLIDNDIKIARFNDNQVDESNITLAHYLSHIDAFLYVSGLSKNHWIHEFLIDVSYSVDEELKRDNNLYIDPVNTVEYRCFKGGYNYVGCTPCEFVRFSGPLGDVDVYLDCVPYIEQEGYGEIFLYVPSKAQCETDILFALSFVRNEEFNDALAHADKVLFKSFLLSLQKDLAAAITESFSGIDFSMFDVSGKSFQLTFDEHSSPVVHLIDIDSSGSVSV
jgi:hypothetical protein